MILEQITLSGTFKTCQSFDQAAAKAYQLSLVGSRHHGWVGPADLEA